jgi:glutamyl-tRNA reductase
MIFLNGIDARQSIGAREMFYRRICGRIDGNYILLNTCDRVELYIDDGAASPPLVEIARHLFRVASGLESPLLGETQIMHQVRAAYGKACVGGTVSPALHFLFQTALHTAKTVRTQTAIGRGAMSHGHAAVEIILDENRELKDSVITIIGVNHLNRNVIRFLVRNGAKTLLLGNRSLPRARELASETGCIAFPLGRLPEVLGRTDILISATSAPHLIVRKEQFPAGRRMLIVDLAVPRDVDESIGQLHGVTLYNIGDVERRVAGNRDLRQREIEHAELIIETELEKYVRRFERQRRYMETAS